MLTTPVNTQDRPYPSEIIVLTQHTELSTHLLLALDAIFQLILHVDVVLYCVTVPALECDHLYAFH